MNNVQDKLLALLRDQSSVPLRYREIGRRIGEKYPQTVKYHIEVLIDKGLITEQNGFLKLIKKETNNSDFLNLPFYGLVNCGPATIFAEDKIEGFIKVSKNILPRKRIDDFIVLRASGNSMNNAKIGTQEKNIEDGDFVIIDTKERNPKNGDYVISVIDDCANIKKYYDEKTNQKLLVSESTDEYFPIVLHENDSFHVMGKVAEVIKNTQ